MVADVRRLFLHGLGDNSSTWHALLSSCPELSGYTPELYEIAATRDRARHPVVAIASALSDRYRRCPPEVVIGHSMGGTVATYFAKLTPGIRAVINIEGNLTTADCTISERLASMTTIDMETCMTASGLSVPDRYVEALHQAPQRLVRADAADLVEMSSNGSAAHTWRTMPCATHYVAGTTLAAETVDLLGRSGTGYARVACDSHWVHEVACDEVCQLILKIEAAL